MAETTREKVRDDAFFILRSLKDNSRSGVSNRLADVKAALGHLVSLEFDNYFFFLRKFHYLAMDREAHLKLTDGGERLIQGEDAARLSSEIDGFFAEHLAEAAGEEEVPAAPPVRVEAKPSKPTSSPLPMASSPSSTSLELAPMPLPPNRGTRKPAPAQEESGAPTTAPLPPPPPVASSPSAIAHGASASSQKGTDPDARYQKGEQVGSGPLGSVFRGKHSALGVEIAIKELKDIFGYFSFLQRGEVIKRLRKELCAQAQVRHPGIVQILDQNTDVSRPYFVMELCRGSLREKLDASEGKGLPVPQAMRYFLQLAYGLRAAHQQGLTHQNIKPENVLFDAWGNAKLADFGLSRVIEVDQTKGMPQIFVGTGGMGYMSPELITRAKEVGPASDVYGLGIVLYEMLTGGLPGRRSPLPSEVNAQVPAKLDPIFDRMTQDRQGARYPDFEAVFDDFYAGFADGTFLARGDLLSWSEVLS
jgi:serine/threonine protein kinase